MSDLYLNLTLRRCVSYVWVYCVHTVQCTLCTNRSSLVTVYLSAVFILNPVLCTQDGVHYAVHMYCVAVQCGSVKTALNQFIVQAYTPEAGQLLCFHPSSLSIVLTLYVRPSQRGTTGQ